MKTEKLPFIGLEQLQQNLEHISYMDNDIAVIDNLTGMLEFHEETVKLDCFIIAFCQEGSIETSINGQPHTLEKDYCAILPPGTILRKMHISNPYILKVAAVSRTFLSDIFKFTKETLNIMHFLFNNPIHPVRISESYKMYLYKELLTTLFQETPHAYSKQARRFHIAGMFCEIMALLNKMIPEHQRIKVNRGRSTSIVRDFIELVNADDGSHRSVSYYADKMCYSSKYLSCIIKQITGKSPLRIINEHAIKEIKYKLKHSEMSMKEMADYFDFSTPSFFGKFVKTHTGMSPLQCRFSDMDEK